ncbi:uncharacterized protein C11orf87 homolog [Trichomycterus rosablanca]|uniref:uncharacterized protein C11orf87 homolog n=1 Tax=Trichomycterus rosablanca TaxID=2290929 RepID=UPI002F35EB60
MSLRSTWRCLNGTCTEKVEPYQAPLSSTFALSLLGIVLTTIVALSLTTHHCQKGKIMKRKIQRAQEEYERDQRSLVPPAEKADPRCGVIARSASGHTDPSPLPFHHTTAKHTDPPPFPGHHPAAEHTDTSTLPRHHLDAGHTCPPPPLSHYPAAGQTDTPPSSLGHHPATGYTNTSPLLNPHPATGQNSTPFPAHINAVDRGELEVVAVS